MALVSIIMPNFNGAKFIGDAIRSVQAQTLSDWELLIADDASTDESLQIAKRANVLDPRVSFLTATSGREGPAVARNRALEAARGRFIAFLDSDDRWTPNKLETQTTYHLDNRYAVTFTALRKMSESGTLLNQVIFGGSVVPYRRLLRRNYLPCSSVIVDRAVTGDFRMPNFLRRQDYALWLQLLRPNKSAFGMPEPMLHYRIYSNSYSASKAIGALYHWKVLREQERLSLLPCSLNFCSYVVGAGKDYVVGRAANCFARSGNASTKGGSDYAEP